MTTEQEQSTAPEGTNTADDGLVKAIARVAHEVVAGHNTAYGNYTTPPWEALTDKDKAHTCAKVAAFLNNPQLHPTAAWPVGGHAVGQRARSGVCLSRGCARHCARADSGLKEVTWH
jgi:hypothetical protein